ncbi:MAG: lytic transglycosylase domain-containing protein, partial [Bartonella sp.]|nr:lytic transglycosylase domain-containing protein [Bartonella sp.]
MFLHAFLIGWSSSIIVLNCAAAENICEAEMITASKRYDVPLGILYAV